MQDNEFSKFLILWRNYAIAINPNSVVTDDATYICFTSLKDYDFSDVKQALARLVKRDVFALKVSDVLNELKGGCKTDVEAMANRAYNNLMNIVEYKGCYHSYIFEDSYIPVVLDILGWDLDKINNCECDGDFARKDFVKFYTNEVLSGRKPQYRELRSAISGRDCFLVSASQYGYNTPVTWKLSPEDKETILLGNEDSDNTVKRITAELPKIPVLPDEETKDPAPPADIRRQKEILEKTINALLGA